MKRSIIHILVCLVCFNMHGQAIVEIPSDLRIKSAHPCLMVDKGDFTTIKKSVASGRNLALVKMHNAYMDVAASSVKNADAFEFELNKSGKLLLVSRKALLELGANAYAYRYSGDKVYLNRASDILKDVCSFDTWNPGHYLDVAEMAIGVSLAYDWLYNKLSPSIRRMCEKAITEFLFETAVNPNYRERFKAKNNWGQVLNAALICSSIVFYDLDPQRSQELIRRAVNDNLLSLESGYAPDGIYPEGAMYWGYGTTFQIMTNEALTHVYGSDFGLSECKGFGQSAEFMIFTCGNVGKAYNYSDSGEKRTSVPSLWYFAHRFDNPDIVYTEYRNVSKDTNFKFNSRTGFIHIYHASLCDVADLKQPSKKVFHGRGTNPLIMARTGWEHSDIYLGAKGGTTRNGHSHMDAGSFVYEADGLRWIREPNAPGYSRTETLLKTLGGSLWKLGQTSLRWKMFGYNNAQHSTLTINGRDHLCAGMATLEEVYDDNDRKGGRFDLSSIYENQAESVSRSICIIDDEYLEVRDIITACDSLEAEVRWNIPTDAQVEVTSDGIILTMKSKQMLLKAEGCRVEYTTDMLKPMHVPEEFDAFYNTNIKFAAFDFTVPAGKTVKVITTLKRIN